MSNDVLIESVQLTVERKTLTVSLMENPRGQFVRIIEANGQRHDRITFPASGLKDLRDTLSALLDGQPATP